MHTGISPAARIASRRVASFPKPATGAADWSRCVTPDWRRCVTVWPWLRALAVELPEGSGFRVQGSGFRVRVSGFRVQGSGFRATGAADWRRCVTAWPWLRAPAVELPELPKAFSVRPTPMGITSRLAPGVL